MQSKKSDDSMFALLGREEPAAFERRLGTPGSPFVIIGDHASRRIPASLGTLGLADSDVERHIGWDIGIAGVIDQLAVELDAFAIRQNWSRLVIDCNRPLDSPTSIPERSDVTLIPGNVDLSPQARRQRQEEIFWPYHHAISAELDRRAITREPTLLVSMHSFTPLLKGEQRPWHLGVLYNRGVDVAQQALSILRESGEWVVGDNQPYAITDSSDYAVPVHAEPRGLPHVELEIRQDLLATLEHQREWAVRVAVWLRELATRVL
ncbi:MAG: N-formylglutamate amidohydrolase [Dokdonella sp.]